MKNEKLEGNKILAEFLKINVAEFKWKDNDTLLVYCDEEGWYDYRELECFIPDHQWDILMQVIDKIESLYDKHHGHFQVIIAGNTCTIQGTNLNIALTPNSGYGYVYVSDPNAIFPTKQESTWFNCVKFVEWYNENLNK